MFPENRLDSNSRLSILVGDKLFEIPSTEKTYETDNDEVNKLYSSLISDDWVKKTVSNSYLLEVFYYSNGNSSDVFNDKIKNAYEKARLYDDEASSISQDELISIDKNINKELKELKKSVRRLNSERIEKEEQKIITPVTITFSHVTPLFSLFSVLFLISGFIYNKLLLSSLGIKASDFFLISDYISSSVDVITTSLIASAIGIFAYLWGAQKALSDKLHAEQFNIETSKNRLNYLIVAVIVLPILILVEKWYKTGELPSNLFNYLYPLVFYALFHFVFRSLQMWKYVKNSFAVGAVIMMVLFFLLDLAVRINQDLQSVENGSYKSSYTIVFKKEYEEYSGHIFFTSNSNYVFLLNKENKKLSVIPKSGIKALNPKHDEDELLK